MVISNSGVAGSGKFEQISKLYFQHSLAAAAKALGIGTTHLKNLCREYGIAKWPFRQVRNLFAWNWEGEIINHKKNLFVNRLTAY